METYSDKLMNCFLEPRGFGDLENYQCFFEIKSEEDGIHSTFFIKLEGDIVQFTYKVSGCSVIIATCCAIYDLYNNKPLKEVKLANMDAISTYLDGIPQSKFRCAQYALETFLGAIERCP